MNVRDIVISEFGNVFGRHDRDINNDLLKKAESPFDLAAVQRAVDSDIIQWGRSFGNWRTREREEYHEQRLRNIARQYAINLLRNVRRNELLTESLASTEKYNLRIQARSIGCDIYPC